MFLKYPYRRLTGSEDPLLLSLHIMKNKYNEEQLPVTFLTHLIFLSIDEAGI